MRGKKNECKPRTKDHACNDVLDMIYDMEKHVGFLLFFQTKDKNAKKVFPGVLKSLAISSFH